MSSPAIHGGDVARAASRLGCPPSEIIDFSANINPRGLPASALAALASLAQSPDALRRYPDWTLHPLRHALALRLQVPPQSLILGAGASALIVNAIRAVRPVRCLCFVPAFAEYRRALEAVGSQLIPLRLVADNDFQINLQALPAAIQTHRPDLLILNNPHNPSGSLTSRHTMDAVLDIAARSGTMLLVDEAFIDYAPDHQITSLASAAPGLIAIRSLTKFYGCPGLRIGYAVTGSSLAAKMDREMASWPVGAPELEALSAAIRDEDYARATIHDNLCERAHLVSSLTELGFETHAPAANFLLLRLPKTCPPAPGICDRLLTNARILVRDCGNFEGLEPDRYIRVAVLDSRRNQLLVKALASLGTYFA